MQAYSGDGRRDLRKGKSNIRRKLSDSERSRKFFELLEKGALKMNSNNPRGAIVSLTRAIKLKPRSPDSYFMRGLARRMINNASGFNSDMETHVILSNRIQASELKREGFRELASGNIELGFSELSESIAKAADSRVIGMIENGYELSERNDYIGAMLQFNRAVALDPWSAMPLIARGKLCLKYRDLNAALEDFNKALDIKESASLYLLRGFCFLGMKNYSEALLDFTKAIDMDPKLDEALSNKAAILNDLGNPELALRDIDAALKINKDPNYFFLRGMILLRLGKFNDANETFGRVVDGKGKISPNALYGKGVALRHLGDLNGSLQCLDEAVRLNPSNHNIHMERHAVRLLAGDDKGAMEDHDNATRIKNENEANSSMSSAIALVSAGKFEAALVCATNAIDLNPNDAETFNVRGTVFFSIGRNENAISDFSKAIGLNPNDALYWNNRSMAHYNNGDYIKSLADATAALRLSPRNPQYYYGQAQNLKEMGRYEEAKDALLKAIRRDPENGAMIFFLGECYYDQGKISDAIRSYRAAIKLDPSDPVYYNDLGYAYYVKGNNTRAISYYQKAAELAEKDGSTYILSLATSNIGVCMEELGNNYEAMKHYTRAIEIFPKKPEPYNYRAQLKEKLGDKAGAEADYGLADDAEDEE